MTKNIDDLAYHERRAIALHSGSLVARDVMRRKAASDISEQKVRPALAFELDRFVSWCDTTSLGKIVRFFPDWVRLNPTSRLQSVRMAEDSDNHIVVKCLIDDESHTATLTSIELQRLMDGGMPVMQHLSSSSGLTSAAEA